MHFCTHGMRIRLLITVRKCQKTFEDNEMKIVTPNYYKDFKCIADKCSDTCCAGWDVDVDEQSYEFYKKQTGEIGERLENVMVPKEEGGCTFTLTENMRCPFLDNENLCDLYKALGESALCETCDEFPRFKNEYGATREIGVAPSCPVVAEMFMSLDEAKLVSETNDELVTTYNDIDASFYFELIQLRKDIFKIIFDKSLGTMSERLEQIYKEVFEWEYEEDIETIKDFDTVNNPEYSKYDIEYMLKPFEGYEVINKDWFKRLEEYDAYKNASADEREHLKEHMVNAESNNYAFENIMFYYIYRFLLQAVYDDNTLDQVKKAVVAFIVCRKLCEAYLYVHKEISDENIADIFHLYSRQFEHSYINFEYVIEHMETDDLYGDAVLLGILNNM